MRRGLSVCLAVTCFGLFAALPLPGQTWRPIGPPGGDVRALAADPNDPRVLYLGVSDGHIFGSRDAGQRWQLLGRVGNRLDSVVTSILADPRNPATLYASTWTLGPNGGGVFRSNDGGHSWRPAGLAGQSVRALAQASSQPDVLVAGTLQGVFRSADAGKTWEQISPADHNELRNFDSVAIDPSNPRVIYAGTYHLAWKTTDGGRQWLPIHTGMVDDSDVMSISIDPTDPQRVFASACSGIYRSENGGALWAKFRGIPPTARRTHLILQDPLHREILYAATTEGLWKTTTGGVAWSRVTPANWSIGALVLHPKSPGRVVIGVEGQGIYISDDEGRNFHAANEGFYHRQVMDLALDPSRAERMLVVLTNSVDPVLATQDGGRTWARLGPGLSAHTLRRVYASPDTWWAALERGGLMRYDAQKNAWVKAGSQVSKETPAHKRGARPAPARPASRPVNQVVNDMAFLPAVWWAGTEEGLLASNDRGASWNAVALGVAEKLPVHSLRVSEDGSRIWLLSPRGMMFSQDRGKTWTWQELNFEPRGRLRLYQPDEHTLVVTSDTGVYASADAGKTWKQYNLPELWIRDLASAGNTLLVSTLKRGLHASYNRGETWEHLEGPLAEGYFPALAAGSGSSVVLAASSTEGLYALEVSRRPSVAASAGQINNRSGSRAPQLQRPAPQDQE